MITARHCYGFGNVGLRMVGGVLSFSWAMVLVWYFRFEIHRIGLCGVSVLRYKPLLCGILNILILPQYYKALLSTKIPSSSSTLSRIKRSDIIINHSLVQSLASLGKQQMPDKLPDPVHLLEAPDLVCGPPTILTLH